MNRRVITIALLSAVMLGAPILGASQAWADDHEDDHAEQSHSSESDDSHDEQGHPSSTGSSVERDHNEATEIDDDHDAARQAVQADLAIPLRRMLEIFQGYGDLTVVDVALVTRAQVLQYRIKYVDPQGRVKQAYFDAQTGALDR
jgi:hypothetical protein